MKLNYKEEFLFFMYYKDLRFNSRAVNINFQNLAEHFLRQFIFIFFFYYFLAFFKDQLYTTLILVTYLQFFSLISILLIIIQLYQLQDDLLLKQILSFYLQDILIYP